MNPRLRATQSSTSRGGTCTCSNPRLEAARRLTIEVTGDFPWARTQLKKVATMLRAPCCRQPACAPPSRPGEIFTVPAEKGQPAQPDAIIVDARSQPRLGRPMAATSHGCRTRARVSTDYAEQTGVTKPRTSRCRRRRVLLHTGVVTRWQASCLLEYNHLALWPSTCHRRHKRERVKIRHHTTTTRDALRRVWSPDSQWIAYSKSLDQSTCARSSSTLDRREGAHQVTGTGLVRCTARRPSMVGASICTYPSASTNYALRISCST